MSRVDELGKCAAELSAFLIAQDGDHVALVVEELPDRRLDRRVPLRGQRDGDVLPGPARARPPNVPSLFSTGQALRDRTRGDETPGRELAGRQHVRFAGPPERAEQIEGRSIDAQPSKSRAAIVGQQLGHLPQRRDDLDRLGRRPGQLTLPRVSNLCRCECRARRDGDVR